MCECINWDFIIESIGVIVFSTILMYKIGCKQGEKTAYKRYLKSCNECRNKNENEFAGKRIAIVRKNRTVEE